MAMETCERRALKVLMLPWLAYGHISPFLELAKRLSRRNLPVFLCSTHTNLNIVRGSIPEDYSSSIRLVEILLPELPDLPPHYHTTNALPPRLVLPLMAAFDEAGPELSGVIADVAPDLLIYDVLLPWAQPVARSHSVPAVVFLTVSLAAASLCMHFAKRRGEEHPVGVSYVRGLRSAAEQNGRVHPQGKQSGASNVERCTRSIEASSDIVLLKSIRELEGKHMDYLESLAGKKVVLVGMPVRDDLDLQDDAKGLMDWLDTKERLSTVFISFGSECFLDDAEREEMAYGLELSEVNFIWVIRFPEGEEIKLEDALPRGFPERVGNRGVVVEKWAPQAKILAHSSIGGFLSHCGWGSLTEGMSFGVPIIAMPMQNDQPLNAGIIKENGVGVEVDGTDTGRMDRHEIAKAVRHVLVDEKGESVRKKAREMGEIIRNRGDAEIDELVVELNKICGSLKH